MQDNAEPKMIETKKRTLSTFDTIREQRGMHCMWIETSDTKEDIEEKS
jgi:hypothetical protein